MSLNKIGAFLGIATGAIALAAASWGAADYLEIRPVVKRELRVVMQIQEQTVTTLALFQFQWLQARRAELQKLGIPMSLEDMQTYCSLAKEVFPDITLEECK